MSAPARILILGGGYAALGATRALRGAMKRGEVEVTVVSRENYHVFHGFVPQMVTGRVGADHILSPVRRIVRPAHLHVGEISGIDFERREVEVRRQLDGRSATLPYDHLLLGLGSRDHLEAYPGLAEHAFRLKTYDDCFQLRNHILAMVELADSERDEAERRRLLTFFIAGGGYAGTEVAAELAEYVRGLVRRDYPRIGADEWRVVLVHPGATILPELAGTRAEGGRSFPRLVAYATRHLEKLGVEIMTNSRVVRATSSEVGLSNGERIPTRTIISAVGTRPPHLVEALPLPRGAGGKVETEATLRVAGLPNVWAAGDCAAIPHPKGGTCPPLAVYALEHGKAAAQNILRTIRGEPLAPFSYVAFGQGVAIGRHRAVAEVKGMEMTGPMAWLIGRLLLLAYVPSAERRVRLLFDWLVSQLVGRNIVEASVADADDYEIAHHLFHAGETLVREGDDCHYLYLILEGEVDLLREGALTGAVGPGGHVGQTSGTRRAPETARARSEVQAVAVRLDQAGRLRRVLATLPSVE